MLYYMLTEKQIILILIIFILIIILFINKDNIVNTFQNNSQNNSQNTTTSELDENGFIKSELVPSYWYNYETSESRSK